MLGLLLSTWENWIGLLASGFILAQPPMVATIWAGSEPPDVGSLSLTLSEELGAITSDIEVNVQCGLGTNPCTLLS